MSWHVCRICLAGDIKTYTIVDTQFQDIYEKITGYEWARDNRPVKICYICKSQLQRSLKFQQMSNKSEEIFDQILAVGFEFTEEILPILCKRRFQTVAISPVSTVNIEPTNVYDYVVNNDCNADENKEEIIIIDNDSNTQGTQEKILKMNTNKNSSRKDDIETFFQKNSPSENGCNKRSLLKNNDFLFKPTPVITDFSSDENHKSNCEHRTEIMTPKNEDQILTNECNVLSSATNKNTQRKSIKLIFKHNDMITPRKSLERKAKQKKASQESSKRNEKIEVPSEKDNKKTFTKKGQFLEKYMESKIEFKCDICNRSFNVKSFLILHMKIHNGDRQFECDKCPKTYTRLCYLNKHKLSHLSKKSFICKICQKGFNHLSNLYQHKMTHTGERPYSCKVCNKKFIQSSHLLQHNRIHSGEKPYSCICGKGFAQMGALMNHRKTHMIVKPFTCDICAKGFNQKNNLKNHLKSAHNLSSSALK